MISQLTITAAHVNYLKANGYTTIEVWASDDYGNSWEEITASVQKPAQLFSYPAQNTFQMGGKLIRLSINGTSEVSFPFNTVVDRYTPAQVASRLNEVVPLLGSVQGKKVVLTSAFVGRISSIKVAYNDAHELGWEANSIIYGREARLPLITDHRIYSFTDVAGKGITRYKWRFSGNGVDPISDFSDYVLGSSPPVEGIPLSIGTAMFVGVDGRPLKTRLIVVTDTAPQGIVNLVDIDPGPNASIILSHAGVGSEIPTIVDSDNEGFVALRLVQGTKIRVAIEGTSFVREFVVPMVPHFNLLQVMADAPDPFAIQVPAQSIIRRAL
jgi:hypothetical protein